MKQTQPKARLPIDGGKVRDDTLQQFVGYQLKRASNAVLNDLASVLKPFELRMITYTALVLIVDNPGMRQSQLADAMDVERPNLVVIIDELERREWIVRDKVASDRRAYALRATLAGHHLYERALKAVHAHEAALVNGIDPEALRTLSAVVLGIQKNAKRNDT
ncbi:MAG: MarR family winged helix-turn-helix transcriptional regulator [Sedimentitalea sp.]